MGHPTGTSFTSAKEFSQENNIENVYHPSFKTVLFANTQHLLQYCKKRSSRINKDDQKSKHVAVDSFF